MSRANPPLIRAMMEEYSDGVKRKVDAFGSAIRVTGILGSRLAPSISYARSTRRAFRKFGIQFTLQEVDRLEVEQSILRAERDRDVHGIFVYYPLFTPQHDRYLQDLVPESKDIEGLSTFWLRRLYANERLLAGEDRERKAITPCTPLAVLKILAHGFGKGRSKMPFAGRNIVIFNRSEVVGRPLAAMLAHDGARVFSFDLDGCLQYRSRSIDETHTDREAALAIADAVVTGVPDQKFPLIGADELHRASIGINVSTVRNFSDEAVEKLPVFVPRVGPVTTLMCIRNTIRLYENFHA